MPRARGSFHFQSFKPAFPVLFSEAPLRTGLIGRPVSDPDAVGTFINPSAQGLPDLSLYTYVGALAYFGTGRLPEFHKNITNAGVSGE